MWFFGKKKETEPLDLSWLHADMHSHLIPGIDDGANNLATSMELIKGLHSFGLRKIITTPHVLWEMYPNRSETIAEGAANVRQAIREAGLNLEFRAAAEYFIDEHFVAELRNKTPLLTLSGNKVLVEFSMVTAPLDLQQVLFDLQMQNYQPVLAHPERYAYFNMHREVYDELKEAGCWFQLNLLSLTGYYGKAIQDLAEYLCKKEYYDLAGTDLHHERHLNMLQKLPSSPTFMRLRESGSLKNAQL
ncbi:MAG TPA: CpsB/CapC family capsule biosynthesis tyrosine phosphatase [Flavisolibacter sp.]|nr:CpsB/CapC family capsule biosynthesis tyrosine phosphatase [Flavisolibacter sp.]